MRDELAARLHRTTNAEDWADAFLAEEANASVLRERDRLVEWFANAIETGRDHGKVVNHGTILNLGNVDRLDM